MSFVTTRPEALLAAANALQTFGSSMATENAAAAAPTTSVAPAAADEVSAMQAALFSAYGAWYQQVSAQAAAIHQQLVTTLGTSAGSYGDTEAANQAATASTPAQGILSDLFSEDSVIGTPIGFGQNFPAAASDLFGLGPGFAPGGNPAAGGAGVADAVVPGVTAGAVSPAVSPSAPVGAAVLASSGQGSSIGRLSVPPSWAADGAPAAGSAPATLTGAGWTNAAPPPSQVTAMPAGVPSVASAGRGGFGAPRYGAKPTVMPKPTVV